MPSRTLCKRGNRGLDIFTSQNPRYGFVEVILACFLLAKLEKVGLSFPLLQAVQFMLIASSLQRVVKNYPDRMAVPGADTADPVSQIDPIDPTGPLHRTVMDGESHRVALP